MSHAEQAQCQRRCVPPPVPEERLHPAFIEENYSEKNVSCWAGAVGSRYASKTLHFLEEANGLVSLNG